MNEDPYAALTYRPNIIRAIEDEIAALPPGE
jgi:hypothetical protein